MKVLFDLYPLANTRYTGIPQMTWHLARRFLDREGVSFCLGHRLLPRECVAELLIERSGRGLNRLTHGRDAKFASAKDLRDNVYFSPHSMSIRTIHGRGAVRIVHDISAITHPQFHHRETLERDRLQLLDQIALCQRILTVSTSSQSELVHYLGVDAEKIVVATPGVAWEASHLSRLNVDPTPFPYVLVLGTREPRKNVRVVLEYLLSNGRDVPSMGRRFVFAGPRGWGTDQLDQYAHDLKPLTDSGWVVVLEHVEEEDKMALMSQADFLIAPSITEGFGSPSAEALSLGVPVVASFGGALSETVGSGGYFFDPFDVSSLEVAIGRIHLDLLADPVGVRRAAAIQGMRFSWDECAETVWMTLREVWRMGANK